MAETRILGRDLEVSAVGLGCMGFTHAYGLPADKDESIKAIHEAVDYGYTFFDTAECYVEKNAAGILERNEDLVGEALKPYRNQIKLASKFGVTITDKGLMTDSRPETIRKAIEGSLSRLQTDHLDLYYQHRIDANTPAEEVAGVMADLIKEGKILHWGISETNEEYLRKAHAVCPVTCIQNRLSMMARWHEALFHVLEELNIGYVAFSPLANGFLTDSFLQSSPCAVIIRKGLMQEHQIQVIRAELAKGAFHALFAFFIAVMLYINSIFFYEGRNHSARHEDRQFGKRTYGGHRRGSP